MPSPIMRTVSMQATRTRPWEHWVEPDPQLTRARYFGVTVDIVQALNQYALIRRPDGLSCIVENSDLEVRP